MPTNTVRAALARVLDDMFGRISEEQLGRIHGAVIDALVAQGCPHGCMRSTGCPYDRRLKEGV